MTREFSWEGFLVREAVIKAARAFFDDQGFYEIIPPVLNPSIPLEPTIYPFVTEWHASQPAQSLYMSASPERGMKLLLAEGIDPAYGIGKSFRNLEGAGSRHHPEFLMLEWYRSYSTYRDIMADVEKLVRAVASRVQTALKLPSSQTITYQGQEFDLSQAWPVLSLEELLEKYAQLKLEKIIEDKALIKAAEKKGYHAKDATWEQLFDQIIVNEVEPHFPTTPFFLIDFPARLSPLCAINKDKPYLAERFEAFMGGMEVGNGNTEQSNAQVVKKYFTQEAKFRRQQLKELGRSPKEVPPLDEAFLTALTKIASSHYAGMGLGIDRIAMIMADTTSISDVEFLGAKP